MRHRTLSRWYANALGYFWLPCPSCGKEFGGQEWRETRGHFSDLPSPESGARGICPDCTAVGIGCWANSRAGMYHYGCEFAPVPKESFFRATRRDRSGRPVRLLLTSRDADRREQQVRRLVGYIPGLRTDKWWH